MSLKENVKGHYRLQIPAVALHVIIWLLIILLPTILFRNVKFQTGLPTGFFLVTTLVHIGLFYLNAYFLYPRLLTFKRWPLYLLSIAVILPALYHTKLLIVNLINPYFVLTEENKPIILFPPVPFLIASFILRFIINRIQSDRREKEKKAEALASELKFLRSQISPHFLFNVMTNLVSMARLKSDLLEPTLIRFSEMLRYSLYETNETRFPVSKEIEYLNNYVELQKLRFGEDVDVKMDIRVDNAECIIEPMLLIPFVENAFKHGIGLVTDPYIHISLETHQSKLLFTVINKYLRDSSSKDRNSGIGLTNVRNRLELLYGKRYDLSIQDNNDLYIVELKLQLSCDPEVSDLDV